MNIDFAVIIGDVARKLFAGKRCVQRGKKLRFGNKESLEVDLDKGVFYDHEAGLGGGTVKLIQHMTGLSHSGAILWLQVEGFTSVRPKPQSTSGQSGAGQTAAPKQSGNGKLKPWQDVKDIYPYHAADGSLILEVVRTLSGSPRFRQREPGQKWPWRVKNVADHDCLLYHLPELGASGTERVWICEGEKDVDRLRAAGKIATTNIGGACKWRKEYAEEFRDKHCIALQDNDEPGRKHTDAIGRSLTGIAASIKILLLPGLADKGDVSDWLDAGHTIHELDQLADAGPEYQPDDEPPDDIDGEIARLARLTLIQYDRERKAAAQRLGIRSILLDRLVRDVRGVGGQDKLGGRPVEFPMPEPWPDPVDGVGLLFDLTQHFNRHLAVPDRVPNVLALWAVHSHCFDLFRYTPRLNFKSATPRAGKSTALDLLKMVVAKSLATENVTAAALFRAIEIAAPTLLIDEADRFLNDNRELVGLLNAGYARGGQVLRCVGENSEVRQFNVFAPVAVAGLSSLPGTLADRSITIPMRRATRGEQKEQINNQTEIEGAILARKIARWVADQSAELEAAAPDMGALFARAAQIWGPLFAVAEVVGDNWPDLVRKCAETLGGADDVRTLGEQLLADVKLIFDEMAATELSTADIVARLIDMSHRVWPEMGRSRRPMTTTRFTQMVGKFRISRRRLWMDGPWGYRLDDFLDAFERYLGP
jgi:hypothetical protein